MWLGSLHLHTFVNLTAQACPVMHAHPGAALPADNSSMDPVTRAHADADGEVTAWQVWAGASVWTDLRSPQGANFWQGEMAVSPVCGFIA